MTKAFNRIRKYVPLYAIITFIITALSGIILAIEKQSVSFADFINDGPSKPFRAIMAFLTSWIPFSLAEILIISSPVWAAILVIIGVKKAMKGSIATTRYISFLASVLCFIFISFVWTYSSGYYNSTIDKKLDFSKEGITKEELYETSIWMRDELNELAPMIEYDENGASVRPYSYSELSKKIYYGYSIVTEEYNILHNFPSRIKPIILSEPMTYTHLSGIYSFMTGEANFNTNYPDYVSTSSAIHEFAHQRGIAREDEANFIAFLVGISSDDAYLQYSGYMDVFVGVVNSLYSESPELYFEIFAGLDRRVIEDIDAFGRFFKKYEDSKASDVAGSMNDKYLQMNGQEQGTKSYGMVTDLCVAYYISTR